MAADAYLLSGGAGGDRSKFQTLWSAHKSRSQGGGNDRRAEAYGARANTTRVGIAYGSIAARSGTTPGRGEVKFYRLDTTTYTLGDLDELPTTVYNYGLATIADGEYMLAWLDLSGKFDDGGRTIGEATWSTGSLIDESGGSIRYLTQVCKDTDQTVTTGAPAIILFQDSTNLLTTYQESWDDTGDGVADGIVLKQIGWYRIGYAMSWEGQTTSAGGSGLVIDAGYLYVGFTNDGNAPYGTIDCSRAKTFVMHDNVTGASIGGQACTEFLYNNQDNPNVIKLLHDGTATTNSRIFVGQHCVFWAEYLGHNATADTTPTTTP